MKLDIHAGLDGEAEVVQADYLVEYYDLILGKRAYDNRLEKRVTQSPHGVIRIFEQRWASDRRNGHVEDLVRHRETGRTVVATQVSELGQRAQNTV